MDTAIAQLFGTKNAVQYLLALHVKPAFNKNLRVEVECKKNTNQTEFAQVDKPLRDFLGKFHSLYSAGQEVLSQTVFQPQVDCRIVL